MTLPPSANSQPRQPGASDEPVGRTKIAPIKPRLRVVAVVVAWNRQELLTQTLAGLAEQTRPVDEVVVIDNASTDDSAAIARRSPVVSEVITMSRNLGGAGGFAAGIARAVVTWDADLVWIMDDDTVPTSSALAALLEARDAYPGQPALLASKAVWTDGREHPMNRPRPRPLLSKALRERARAQGVIPIRTASFVSIMMDRRAIIAEGLPEADYFLWNDDFEYTSRLLRRRVGLYVPDSVVVHKTKQFGNAAANPGPRFRNEVRNKIWTYTSSDGLNPLEKVLYGGKTALRWAGLLARNDERGELWRYAAEGWRDARGAVRPTLTLLADTPVAEDVRTLERWRGGPDAEPAHPAGIASPASIASPAGIAEEGADETGAGETGADERRDEAGEATPPFSVLISVYAGDDPDHFERALRSVSADQTLRPDQIVLVQDGPVGPALAERIAKRARIAGQDVDLVTLPENVGLARALQAGLQECQHDLIARADADDISLPHRFAVQVPRMGELDLLGGAIGEFTEDEEHWSLIRRHPTDGEELRRVIGFRDPFNHPSVVVRKSAIERAGGYQDCTRLEDYWLFARMVAGGACCANLAEPLVAYRVGAGAYARRGGADLWRSEVEFQRRMRQAGIITGPQWARNLAVRSSYRLIPTPLRRLAYRAVGSLTWFRAR